MTMAALHRAFAAEHGFSRHRARTFVIWGFIDEPGRIPSDQPVKMRPSEQVGDFGRRLTREYPALRSRADASRFRAALGHLTIKDSATHTAERYDEAIGILQAEGNLKPIAGDLRKLIGGSHASASAHLRLRRTGRPPGCPSDGRILRELDIYRDQLDAMIGLGMLEELREGSGVQGSALAVDGLHGVLVQRFLAMAPGAMGIERILHYLQARRALKLPTDYAHPPAFLEGVVDMLVELKQPATVDALKYLIAGDLEQIRDYLRDRARSRSDVPMPKRSGRGHATLAELRADAPAQLKQAWRTCLDDQRGSTMTQPGPSEITGILGIAHAQVHAISIVVCLHGHEHAALGSKLRNSLPALRFLAPKLIGTDVTDPVALRAAFTAIRLLNAAADDAEQSKVNRDINAWQHAVAIFEDYLSQAGIPDELRSYLAGIAPALPAGSDNFFKQVQDDLAAGRASGKTDRVKRLAPILRDVRGFAIRGFAERARFKAFRDSVMATLAEAEARGGPADAIIEIGRHTEILPATADRAEIKQTYHYIVRHWRTVASALQRLRPGRERFCNVDAALPSEGWEAALFENRFVVEYLGCEPFEAGRQVSPMAWIGFHEKRAFWQPLDVKSDTLHRERCEFIAAMRFTDSVLRAHGQGIGDFENYKKGIARRARDHLGMTLLPIEEVNHSQLIGLSNITTRLDQAIRSGEVVQFNIGSGLKTPSDLDGTPFAVFSAIPKYQHDPRRFTFSDKSEDVLDELLEASSARFHGGRGIPELPKAKGHGIKGPEREAYLFGHRDRTLRPSELNLHSRLLLAGCYDLRGHDLKYVWERLEKLAGRTIEERRIGHGHANLAATAHYDIETPDEETANDRIQRDFTIARRDLLDGKTPMPVIVRGIDALRRELLLLQKLIEFHTEVGELHEVDRLDVTRRAVRAKLDSLNDDG